MRTDHVCHHANQRGAQCSFNIYIAFKCATQRSITGKGADVDSFASYYLEVVDCTTGWGRINEHGEVAKRLAFKCPGLAVALLHNLIECVCLVLAGAPVRDCQQCHTTMS